MGKHFLTSTETVKSSRRNFWDYELFVGYSITYEGRSIDELREDFQAGIDSYLEGCKEMGITPRKGFDEVLNVSIPFDIHCWLAMMAEKNNTSIDAIICSSIERHLD